MFISVVIPTYNRYQYLERLLLALREQTPPEGTWEVLVVDNACQLSTRRIVFEIAQNFPVSLTYVPETKLGLNNARNTGISKSSGDLIAFLDDDEIPIEEWVWRIEKTFLEHPEASCIGGKVDPFWETIPPSWITARFIARLSVLDLSPTLCEVEFPKYIVGGNSCYQASVFKTVGLFSSDLDRKGQQLLSSGEVELCIRIERAGGRIYYCPELIVKHSITKNRTSHIYLLKRGYWQAVSDAIIDKRHFAASRCTTKLRERIINLTKQVPVFVRSLYTRDQKQIMIIVDKLVFTLGYIHGMVWC